MTISEAITVALITGFMSVLGVVLSNMFLSRKTQHQIERSLAVTETKLTELTREVREHNGFARRLPVLEEQVSHRRPNGAVNQRGCDRQNILPLLRGEVKKKNCPTQNESGVFLFVLTGPPGL